ncbi:hypothetical protein PG994_000184 [Apiospora phragmitis]|uniref:C-type lectin domain-containing protein n=1 Tax=Apiospora phragmitis TaxID=2905665 RepID=A0ABR1X5P9_9PEZI
MQFIFALVFFLLGLGANAATFNDITGSLPDCAYMADMEDIHHGLLNITDLDGNPVQGSPFVLDTISTSAPVIHDDPIRTKDAWGCVANEFGDYGFWHDAGQKLGRWCDNNQMPANKIYWWQTEEEQAYICNWAGVQACSYDAWDNRMRGTIDQNCNGNGAGWFLEGSGNKGFRSVFCV